MSLSEPSFRTVNPFPVMAESAMVVTESKSAWVKRNGSVCAANELRNLPVDHAQENSTNVAKLVMTKNRSFNAYQR